jgi:predicted patatin/cPLA2 family phospholipase
MKNIGLVLEGGGMRGVYTAGVLEYLMEDSLIRFR